VPELTDRIWANNLQALERGHVPPILGTFGVATEEILGKYTEGYTGRAGALLSWPLESVTGMG
jgi:hypothetical protein